MRLIVDAMGGDNAPLEIVVGALQAIKAEPSVSLVFTGDEERIRSIMKEEGFFEGSEDRVRIVPAQSAIEMKEDPLCILKTKKDSSMAKGLALLRDGEGDAFLSAGSTGALIVGASSRVYKQKIDGVRRCAIGTVLPFCNPTLLLDSGANIEVTPEELCQFAHMGNAYMKGFYSLENPRIGLVNNGAEECKGTALYAETHRLLREEKGLNFIGNVEGRDIPLGASDVVVCDGFTGNIILKLSEGFGSFLGKSLKEMLYSSLKNKIAGLMIRSSLNEFKASLSSEKTGGAPLLGTKNPIIKAHGSSKRGAVKNAVFQAKRFYEAKIGEMIEKNIAVTGEAK